MSPGYGNAAKFPIIASCRRRRMRELVVSVYGFVVRAGHIPEDWFARHVAAQDRTDGGLDTLSARIAQDPDLDFHRQSRLTGCVIQSIGRSVTRQVEDNLSDALHERLAQRFVDRRTSVLMRRLRENAMLEAEVTPSGDVMVAGQHVGQLNGFRFTPDPERWARPPKPSTPPLRKPWRARLKDARDG